MELTGQIKEIFETQQVSEKFKKRDFVLTDASSQYPQHIIMQVTQDKTSLLDKFKIGDTITAHINIRGRNWTNPTNDEVKYFVTIEAWRLVAGTGNRSDNSGNETPVAETFNSSAQDDDLPF